MKQRHSMNFAPEVVPPDLENAGGPKIGGGKMISMAGAPPIQPYQAPAVPSLGSGKYANLGKPHAANDEGIKKAIAVAGALWLGGVLLLGYSWIWPLQLLLEVLSWFLSIPPFSWIFGWIWSPLSWVFGWMYRGAPIVEQRAPLQELRLPSDQVSTYVDSYAQQYGDAALIFAAHDGYPQLVNGLLFNHELGYHDLIDATDENGNTALIYAAAKGFRQCTATLLRNGADPDVANQGGGGRTPLMEAAGNGNKDIVAAIRLANATVDLVDDFGNTALHYAAYHGHLSVVSELLKSSPNRDIKNSYGHTPTSYAMSNKHKAVADLLNRAPTRREKTLKDKEPPDDLDFAAVAPRKPKDEKHVKGGAEDLHKRDQDFAPKLERAAQGISDGERKSLEDQIAKLKREHEELELKAQKRIVELLEKNSNQQQAIDNAGQEIRGLRMNVTDIQLRIQELESKRRSSELRAEDERQRAERLREELQQAQLEADRHKSRAEGAERERDLHLEASKRHEESLRRKHDEVNEHLTRLERQTQEMSALRDDLHRRETELREQRDRVRALQQELDLAKGMASGDTLSDVPQTPKDLVARSATLPAAPPDSGTTLAPDGLATTDPATPAEAVAVATKAVTDSAGSQEETKSE